MLFYWRVFTHAACEAEWVGCRPQLIPWFFSLSTFHSQRRRRLCVTALLRHIAAVKLKYVAYHYILTGHVRLLLLDANRPSAADLHAFSFLGRSFLCSSVLMLPLISCAASQGLIFIRCCILTHDTDAPSGEAGSVACFFMTSCEVTRAEQYKQLTLYV